MNIKWYDRDHFGSSEDFYMYMLTNKNKIILSMYDGWIEVKVNSQKSRYIT